jgi:hypothetical protein
LEDGKASERRTYQKDRSHIQQESKRRVQNECEYPGSPNIGRGDNMELRGSSNEEVHDGAYRSVVIQGNERIHVLSFSTEKDLNHDKTYRLSEDTTSLVEEADPDEFDLAKGCKGDPEDYGEDVVEDS